MIFALDKAPPRVAEAAPEVARLQALQAAGLEVAPTLVLAGVEAEFYQLGNLAEQITRAFEGVFGARLDEARLEAASAQAERLLRESYMLPERSDEVKAALPAGQLLVRYAGQGPFALETGRQEALWALKRLWASRWQVDEVLERQPALAPPDVPSLIQGLAGDLEPDGPLSDRAAEVLGAGAQVWASGGRVVRVEAGDYR